MPLMSRIPALSLLALGCALALSACDRGGNAPPQEPAAEKADAAGQETFAAKIDRSKAGTPAPAAAFADAQGKMVTMADFAGRPVLVNLWATWCGPCKKEMPALDALAKQLGDKVVVLPISQDLDGMKAVAPFWKEGGYTAMRPYADAENIWLVALGNAATLPTTILYDGAGKEVWRVTGEADWSDPAVAGMIGSGSN